MIFGPSGTYHVTQVPDLFLENAFVEEQDSTQCLVLRGRADFPSQSEVRQECIDLGFTHSVRMLHSVEA